MTRKEFFDLIRPLTDKLYRHAYSLVPDDLQAEQLVIDGVNAFLLKERKAILNRGVNAQDKKEMQLLKRTYFKSILRYIGDIGCRRSLQLMEQMKLSAPEDFRGFYTLEPKTRFVLGLRYEALFTVEEIEEIAQILRYEVIEKIHNGRFLLLNQLKQGVTV